MDSGQITELVVSIGGQLSALLFTYFKLKGRFDNKINEIKQHTNISVQRLNGMLFSVINSFDRPAWIKVAQVRSDGEVEFRMMEVNEAYCSTYGLDRKDYIGKTDLEVGWDKATADLFRKHDLSVWASGEAETFDETIQGKKMRFRKIRIQSNDGMSKGIMGYAIDCTDPTVCPYWNGKKIFCADCNLKKDSVAQHKAEA